MKRITTHSFVFLHLEAAIAEAGSAKAWAQEIGVSPQLVCDVRKGRREPNEAIARALGFRRVVMFERI